MITVVNKKALTRAATLMKARYNFSTKKVMGYTYSGSQFPQQKPKLNELQSIAVSLLEELDRRVADEAAVKFRLVVCDKIIAAMSENIKDVVAPKNAEDVINGFEVIKSDALKQLEGLINIEQTSPLDHALDLIVRLLTRTY